MSEMFRHRPFPFADGVFPQDLGAVVMKTVLDGQRPALHVVHTPDNAWAIADGLGDPNEPGACQVTHIWHVLATDPSLAELATLPVGFQADRDAPGRPWTISMFQWVAEADGKP